MKCHDLWKMMLGILLELRWKVSGHSALRKYCFHSLSSTGGISLSKEDKPPDSMLHKHTNTNATNLSASGSHPPSSSAQSGKDNDSIAYLDDDEEEEDNQSFLERHSSLRFLLAGGIAGTGTYLDPT
jgi:hypothetical protein